jgi:hypothetical protein
MGFKHGTALLTSNELASPISWGLMRPVILLNTRAVEAPGEAEAIIAHELAHVARMDWIKLLLARRRDRLILVQPIGLDPGPRSAPAARGSGRRRCARGGHRRHRLRPAAGRVARHECPGLLLGAHGVAPSKGSLSRRSPGCSSGKSVRGPAARSFAAGVFVGAVAVAAPLAALTADSEGVGRECEDRSRSRAQPGASHEAPSQYYPPNDVPTDLPSIISDGVAASVQSAVAAINPGVTVRSGRRRLRDRQLLRCERQQEEWPDDRAQSQRRHRDHLSGRFAGPAEDGVPRRERSHVDDLHRCE